MKDESALLEPLIDSCCNSSQFVIDFSWRRTQNQRTNSISCYTNILIRAHDMNMSVNHQSKWI